MALDNDRHDISASTVEKPATTLPAEHAALQQFVRSAPFGLVQTGIDGSIADINPLAAEWLAPLLSPPSAAREATPDNLIDLLEPLAEGLRARIAAYAAPLGSVCESLHLALPDRRRGDHGGRVLALTLLKLDGQRLMAVLSDRSDAQRRERETQREAQRQARWRDSIVVGLNDHALLTLDGEGRICDWNLGVHRVTGFDRRACIGRSLALFYPPLSLPPERLRERLREADEGGYSIDEGWRLRADGLRFWGSCLIAPLHERGAAALTCADERGAAALTCADKRGAAAFTCADERVAPGLTSADDRADTPADERRYSVVIRDISERRAADMALRSSASYDPLTGLDSRHSFLAAAELEWLRWQRAPRPLSLLMIGVDDFVSLRERHGVAAADTMLRHVAASLSAGLRAHDTVARLDGSRYVALLPDTTVEGAQSVALRLCLSLCPPGPQKHLPPSPGVCGPALPCTVGIGVAAVDAAVDGVHALLQRGDAALAAAQATGRSRVVRWNVSLAALPGALRAELPGDLTGEIAAPSASDAPSEVFAAPAVEPV